MFLSKFEREVAYLGFLQGRVVLFYGCKVDAEATTIFLRRKGLSPVIELTPLPPLIVPSPVVLEGEVVGDANGFFLNTDVPGFVYVSIVIF